MGENVDLTTRKRVSIVGNWEDGLSRQLSGKRKM